MFESTNKMKVLNTVLLSLMLVTGGAMAQQAGMSSSSGASSSGTDNARSATSDTAASDTAGAKQGANATVSAADKKMMTQLAQANAAEIAISKLAQTQSKNADVQAYAQKLIEDHTQAGNSLTQLAQSKGVTLPTEPDAKHQALAKRLGQVSGEKFDKQYIRKVGIEDHKDAVKLAEKISKRAKDPELKALGEKLLPALKEHLDMAKKLKK